MPNPLLWLQVQLKPGSWAKLLGWHQWLNGLLTLSFQFTLLIWSTHGTIPTLFTQVLFFLFWHSAIFQLLLNKQTQEPIPCFRAWSLLEKFSNLYCFLLVSKNKFFLNSEKTHLHTSKSQLNWIVPAFSKLERFEWLIHGLVQERERVSRSGFCEDDRASVPKWVTWRRQFFLKKSCKLERN